MHVRDNGVPAVSNSEAFVITVSSLDELFDAIVHASSRSTNGFAIVWNSEAGQTYRVQYQKDLNTYLWTNLPGDVTAVGPVSTNIDYSTNSVSQRFYRIIRLLQ